MADNIVQRVDALRASGMSWAEVAQELGYTTKESLRSVYRRRKGSELQSTNAEILSTNQDYDYQAAKIIFEDKKIPEDVNWRELIELASTSQNINSRLSDFQQAATIKLNVDKPIAIAFTGDWHLGDGISDHAQWKADIEYMLDTENLYMVLAGDEIQNMRNFKTLSGVLGQVLQPAQQAYLLRSVIDELTDKNKLLAKVVGNHDGEFDERIFGEALQAYLLRKMKAPRFQNRGLLKLYVGEQLYTILLFHKSRFRSFMRTTHGNYREYQLSYPADVVVGAHDHVPGFELMYHYTLARSADMSFGGETYLVKIGSYQSDNGGYGWKYFHHCGQFNPTVVFYPDEHKKLFFSRTEDAVKFIS